MATAPLRVQAAVRAALEQAGVDVVSGVAAGAQSDRALALGDGRTVEADAVLWATGVAAPGFLAASGLDCDVAGCVRVDATLRSPSHRSSSPPVTARRCPATAAPRPACGPCGRGRRWRRTCAVSPLARPRCPGNPNDTRWPSSASARGGRWHGAAAGPSTGRLAAWWKARIDRRWMAMYQSLRPMAQLDDPMRCGGCGAKIGPEALAEALAGLAEPARPDIPVGLADGDDAAVTLPPAGLAVVQSVDHFRAFVDDPYVFGKIAAAHALSDIHAMGARPWTAMAIAALPFMPGRRMGQDLRAMMLGAVEVLRGDGCVLIGGHSAEGAEASLGFAVTGLAEPGSLWRKGALRVGRRSGAHQTAWHRHRAGRADARVGQGRVVGSGTGQHGPKQCRSGPGSASHGVIACTDVTGFGFAGHLLEMLREADLGAHLDPSAIPLLPGAAELAGAGVASTLAPANLAQFDIGDPSVAAILADPQTSGGLLAGVAPARLEACLAALRAAGCPAAALGRVVAGPTRLLIG